MGQRKGQHAQRRNGIYFPVDVPVMPQGTFQGCKGEFVDAKCPVNGISLDFTQEVLFPDNDAGLGPPKELVSTEGDNVYAGFDGLLNRGFL